MIAVLAERRMGCEAICNDNKKDGLLHVYYSVITHNISSWVLSIYITHGKIALCSAHHIEIVILTIEHQPYIQSYFQSSTIRNHTHDLLSLLARCHLPTLQPSPPVIISQLSTTNAHILTVNHRLLTVKQQSLTIIKNQLPSIGRHPHRTLNTSIIHD